MSLSAPLDAMFVASKTREHPMHVDGFHVFRLPDGAGPTPCRRCTGASPPGPRPFSAAQRRSVPTWWQS